MNKKMLPGLALIILGVVLFVIFNPFSKFKELTDTNKAGEVLENSKAALEKKPETKTLVAYFSRAGENYNVGEVEIGNTALMASYIAEEIKADTFEIVPVNSYSTVYKTATEEAKKEQNEKARPKIKNALNNIEDYDTIFLGYPIWWGDMPMIVYTFLESYDLSGKTIIPFNTHEGSGSAGTYDKLKKVLKDSNVETNGLALTGKVARTIEGKEKTIKWVKEIYLSNN